MELSPREVCTGLQLQGFHRVKGDLEEYRAIGHLKRDCRRCSRKGQEKKEVGSVAQECKEKDRRRTQGLKEDDEIQRWSWGGSPPKVKPPSATPPK